MTNGSTKELKLRINKQLNTKNEKLHINTTIDTSFSIQMRKSDHFLFQASPFQIEMDTDHIFAPVKTWHMD